MADEDAEKSVEPPRAVAVSWRDRLGCSVKGEKERTLQRRGRAFQAAGTVGNRGADPRKERPGVIWGPQGSQRGRREGGDGEEGSWVKLRSRVEPCKLRGGGGCYAKYSWKSLGKKMNNQIGVPKNITVAGTWSQSGSGGAVWTAIQVRDGVA